ncbi:MAG TPA: hypothetical protein VJ180_01735 [Pyrinomonadaceae bacterium]|nr:hypothetical protein [Pyrinomonadaceae bacterium]
MIDLYVEFRKLVSRLHQDNIDFALCGGLEMAVYGRPRATIDIDLFIPSDLLERALSAAADLGYTIRGRDLSLAAGAVEIRRVSKIDPESGDLLSLDLLLVTPNILPVWQSRTSANWEAGDLPVVSRQGLISLKRLRGSGRDLDDIKELEEDITNADT